MTVMEIPIATEAFECRGYLPDGEPVAGRSVSGLLNETEPLLFALEPDLEEYLTSTGKNIVLEKTFELKV